MGSPKPLLERALEAARGRRAAIVLPSVLAASVSPRDDLQVVVNDAPERGMVRSLALANAALAEPDAALIVLLVDTPLVDCALVERVVAARGEADVAYPVRDGFPGHPVALGARPRAEIATLPDGDSLRTLQTTRAGSASKSRSTTTHPRRRHPRRSRALHRVATAWAGDP